RECESCGAVFYAPISPAVITAVERDGRLLLAHNVAWNDERYSVIAGFVEPGERLEEAVKREIREEVNISVKGIKYFGSQTWPFPNSLMLGFTAEYESGEIRPDGEEISHAGFFTPDEIRGMNIPDKASIARKLIDSFLASH
ncbi:MAG: NAD(+) diphosphatase, partial [Synergistaceae bacterium]|nr:NAD(+) diphosphatase [Synergistaceae bacterium]